MTTKLNQTVAEIKADNLFYANDPAANTDGAVIASGQGKLARGTALAKNDSGKYVILGTEKSAGVTFAADAVLTDAIDATSADTSAVIYRTGHFNAGALIVKTGYTLTDADKDSFRAKGILLSTAN